MSQVPPSTESDEDREKRIAWWRDAKFGMFIHFGIYAGLGGVFDGKRVDFAAEWIQQAAGLDGPTYEKAAIPNWKPSKDCAKHWAATAKKAGCKYMVLTTKHHDGFSLFDSKLSDFTSQKVIGRDLVKEYVDAAREAGIRVGLYHSLIDWHHPEYDYTQSKQLFFPKDEQTRVEGRKRDHNKYLEFLHGQVEELLTNYGKIDLIWFDYSAEDFQGQHAWKSVDLVKKIKSLQKDIIINNRLYRSPESGWSGMEVDDFSYQLDYRYGDYITPEQVIPGEGMDIPWESCLTFNKSWGWASMDTDWKSEKYLTETLVDVVSKKGNLLLNVGPKEDGSIPEPCVERLEAIGKWNEEFMPILRGSVGPDGHGPYSWGRAIKNPKSGLYLFVFGKPKTITVPKGDVKSAESFSGEPLTLKEDGGDVVIELPEFTHQYANAIKVSS